MLHIRDDAFAQLGDTNLADVQVQGTRPSFNVTSVENFTRRRTRSWPARVPGHLRGARATWCPTASRAAGSQLDANGLPSQNGTYTANFNCGVPHAAVDAVGARRAVRRSTATGCLGTAAQATSSDQQILAPDAQLRHLRDDEIGFSNGDVPNIVGNILPQLWRTSPS